MTCSNMWIHAKTSKIDINRLHLQSIGMVKRGGKEVITVEIFKETYDVMKVNAEKRRWNTKDYINTVLMEAIERGQVPSVVRPVAVKDRLQGQHPVHQGHQEEQNC